MSPVIENCGLYTLTCLDNMAIRVVEVSNGGYEIREIFVKKSTYTKDFFFFHFELWINGELTKSAKIWLSKSIFYVKNHWNLLWVCWFFGKNLSNFVHPTWKFNNPYYHSLGMSFVSNRERKYDMSCRNLDSWNIALRRSR